MAKITKNEPDSVYFLKILLYFTLGTIWLKWNCKTVLPIGLIAGLLFAQHEHFRIDRKMEYAILLIASILGLTGVVGLTLSYGCPINL